ncbi:hypothetical protein F2Q70_00006239 [Brassica cretica]|uniref:Uncharacterized protein n=1 Tax=Brassica cretica TaxID=69181 RepID=A0A8S9ISR1_BRACR|nr:hypothetical protein F2Q70_00006239 [Brassica cretica]
MGMRACGLRFERKRDLGGRYFWKRNRASKGESVMDRRFLFNYGTQLMCRCRSFKSWGRYFLASKAVPGRVLSHRDFEDIFSTITGLGNRVAYQFVRLFGSSSLGLGYSLVFSEALLAPAIPSVSARAGGIFLPLVKSLCVACGSNVGDGTEHRLGAWLMLTCFQTSVISSSMFLTAMAANPLSANLAFNTIKQTIGWTDWAKAAIVPGVVSLIVVPFLLYLIYPPTVKSSPDAPKLAQEKLDKMGPMSKNELIMAATLFLTVSLPLSASYASLAISSQFRRSKVGLWIFGAKLSVDAVTAAILGLSVLLVTGVVTWKECLAESVAWDTLTWFAALIAMAGYLNKYGLIEWFSQTVVKFVGGLGLSWQLSFGILVLLYFYTHYFFASGAAHIGAMFTAFLSVSTALGTPPYFAALVLAFLSNLMGGLTHYGIGSAPIFYGANYVPLSKWWGYGFLISIVNILIWLGTGLGNRVAYQFVRLFGSSSLGLGYSLVFSEALLAPAIPSVSARAGGIFLPLVKSLCVACGSNVGDGTEHRLGAWLMLTCFQTSVISSSMFLTAMAANPLSANLAFNTIKQTIGWTDWAKAAIVPGIVSLIVVPFLLYLIYPPTVKSSPDAPKLAQEKLDKMGPMSKNELIMAATLFLTVSLPLSASSALFIYNRL